MIRIRSLTKKIGSTLVLDNISMDMQPGRITGLSGPNGSGKTMLMRAIVGLIKPTSGSVEVFGRDPWAHSMGHGRSSDSDSQTPDNSWPYIGLLLEGPAFLDGYTGLRNLELLASIRGRVGKEEICSAIRGMGLDPDDKRKYRKYSLGMKQRLGIAGAIMESPDILILDEPTNALDSSGVGLVTARIRQEADRGAVVVLASHDTDVLRGLSDEIWYLAEGHIDGHEILRTGAGRQDDAEGAVHV